MIAGTNESSTSMGRTRPAGVGACIPAEGIMCAFHSSSSWDAQLEQLSSQGMVVVVYVILTVEYTEKSPGKYRPHPPLALQNHTTPRYQTKRFAYQTQPQMCTIAASPDCTFTPSTHLLGTAARDARRAVEAAGTKASAP